jgi:hypothetical protein
MSGAVILATAKAFLSGGATAHAPRRHFNGRLVQGWVFVQSRGD